MDVEYARERVTSKNNSLEQTNWNQGLSRISEKANESNSKGFHKKS